MDNLSRGPNSSQIRHRRSPAFYPGNSSELAHELRTLLHAAASKVTCNDAPKAIVAPHAVMVYSGPIAAGIYACIPAASRIRRVVLLGPTHRVAVDGLALPAATLRDTARRHRN